MGSTDSSWFWFYKLIKVETYLRIGTSTLSSTGSWTWDDSYSFLDSSTTLSSLLSPLSLVSESEELDETSSTAISGYFVGFLVSSYLNYAFGVMRYSIPTSSLVFSANGVMIAEDLVAFFFAFKSTFVSLLSDLEGFRLSGSWMLSCLIFSAFGSVLFSNQSWGSYITGVWCFLDITEESWSEDKASEDISKESLLSASFSFFLDLYLAFFLESRFWPPDLPVFGSLILLKNSEDLCFML